MPSDLSVLNPKEVSWAFSLVGLKPKAWFTDVEEQDDWDSKWKNGCTSDKDHI